MDISLQYPLPKSEIGAARRVETRAPVLFGECVIGFKRGMIVNNDTNIPEFCTKRTLILGCGNLLFGDDGFGPAVIEYLLRNYEIPDDVYVADVGTGARKLLFTISLGPVRPRQIIIVDAVVKGKMSGEIFELSLADLPLENIDDFSLHQVPSSNLARELREDGVDVRVMVCQAGPIPRRVKPGLSDSLKEAVPRMCNKIASEFWSEV